MEKKTGLFSDAHSSPEMQHAIVSCLPSYDSCGPGLVPHSVSQDAEEQRR